MKTPTSIINLLTRRGVASREAWVLLALLTVLNLLPADRVTAQTFTTVHSFTGSDGASPHGGLITNSSGNTLYGTAQAGGNSGNGTVFAVNTDGTGFTTLHSFTSAEGGYPYAGLILSGNTLYGTASQGGSSDNGTVFSLSSRPQLTITASGATNVILSWPVSYAGFSYAGYILEVTADLGSPDAWVPSDFFPPEIVNGQLRLTGPCSAHSGLTG